MASFHFRNFRKFLGQIPFLLAVATVAATHYLMSEFAELFFNRQRFCLLPLLLRVARPIMSSRPIISCLKLRKFLSMFQRFCSLPLLRRVEMSAIQTHYFMSEIPEISVFKFKNFSTLFTKTQKIRNPYHQWQDTK